MARAAKIFASFTLFTTFSISMSMPRVIHVQYIGILSSIFKFLQHLYLRHPHCTHASVEIMLPVLPVFSIPLIINHLLSFVLYHEEQDA